MAEFWQLDESEGSNKREDWVLEVGLEAGLEAGSEVARLRQVIDEKRS